VKPRPKLALTTFREVHFLPLSGQLTDDSNVEITNRDLREREVRAHYALLIGYHRAKKLTANRTPQWLAMGDWIPVRRLDKRGRSASEQ
jgi:hypothetical protein